MYRFDATDSIWAVGFGLGYDWIGFIHRFKIWPMKVSLNPIDKDSIIQRVMAENGVCIGSAILDVSGFWYFLDNGNGGWYEAHLLRSIADLLDELNAPYEAQLKAYFDSQPKETDQSVEDISLPF